MKHLFICIFLCWFMINLSAQDKAAYDALLNQVKNLSSEQVIERGDNYLKQWNTDTTIVL